MQNQTLPFLLLAPVCRADIGKQLKKPITERVKAEGTENLGMGRCSGKLHRLS